MICLIHRKKAAWVVVRRAGSHSIINTIGKSLPRFKFNEILRYHVPEDWYCFTFVRNPFERLVSAWQETILECRRGGVVRNFRRRIGSTIRLGMPFPEFVEALVKLPLACVDQHFLPQATIFSEVTRVDFVGKLETIDEDWPIVAKRLGFIKPLPINHKSKARPAYQSFYTEELRQQAELFYGADCEQFGYSF